MHRSFFVVMFVLLTAAAVFANPNYYVNIGMSKPFAPENFQEDWRSGFNVGAGLGYNLSPKFELQAEILYDNFQLDDNSFLGNYTDLNDLFASVSGGTTSLAGAFLNAKFLSPMQRNTSFTPYFIASVGLVSKMTTKMEVTTEDSMFTVPKDSQVVFGGGVGLGVEIVMGKRTSFVVEGRFNVLATDKTTVYFPLKLGIVIR